MQLLGIPPEMRSNFDYIFLLAEDFISNRKRLYDQILVCSTLMFQQSFLDVTENYGCMVIDNRVHSKDITKVFWYKAKTTLALNSVIKNTENIIRNITIVNGINK